MKEFKAIQTGVLIAIKVFLYFIVFTFPVIIFFDYFEGKSIQVYFTFEFVFNFISQPIILGLLSVFVILSCTNQLIKLKRSAT